MAFSDLTNGLINFNGTLLHVEVFLADARALHAKASAAKQAGDVESAARFYHKLLGYIEKVDELGLSSLPAGLQYQVILRALELLEDAGRDLPHGD